MPPAYYDILFAVFAFLLGAAIGSFLNVCIYRLPLDLSVNEPKRSFCPSCKYQIPWYRNLPLISWLSLRGKCANCGSPISFRYFGVELLTALLFLAVWWRVWIFPRPEWQDQGWVLALPFWIFVSLLIVATFIDFEHFIIPDQITWGGAITGLVLSFVFPPMMGEIIEVKQFFATLPGLVIWSGFIWLANTTSGPLRDMKAPRMFAVWFFVGAALAALIAAFLGAQMALNSFGTSLAGATSGYLALWAVVEMGKIVFGKKSFNLAGPTPFTWTRRPASDGRENGSDADLVVGDVAWKTLPKPSLIAGLRDLLRKIIGWLMFRPKDQQRGESWIWSEIFSRDADRLIIATKHVKIDGEEFVEGELVFEFNQLQMGSRHWKLEEVDQISGEALSLIVPREAMGFGDVKFIAAIGAFLGWKAVGFTIMAGSTIGAVVGVTCIALGRREVSAKIPFGPYLALGAILWIFSGPELVQWYLSTISPPVGG